MASHHYIGKGHTSAALGKAAADPQSLSDSVERMVEDSGLEVVERQLASFPQGGMTLMWVLAESHLVLHYWAEERFSTIDIHVCDYGVSNAQKAEILKASLDSFCFVPATSRWRSLTISDPKPRIAAASHSRSLAATEVA